MAKMRRSLSSLLARLLQAFNACTNSCTSWDVRPQPLMGQARFVSALFTSPADCCKQIQNSPLP